MTNGTINEDWPTVNRVVIYLLRKHGKATATAMLETKRDQCRQTGNQQCLWYADSCLGFLAEIEIQ